MMRPEVGPAYQAPLAAAVKKATGVATMAVGMIRDPHLAEQLIHDGQCDMVALARGMLYEPRWTWRAAFELRSEAVYPEQYKRGNPLLWPQAFPEASDLAPDQSGWVVGSAPHILVPSEPK
jgi:NADPH2 dehydrogenase